MRHARALIFVSLLAAPAAIACTISWTGTAGDGNWSTAANWSPGTVPAPADDVCISAPGTYVVSATFGTNASFYSLTIGAGSGSQTVDFNGFTLTFATIAINSGGDVKLHNTQLTGAVTISSGGTLEILSPMVLSGVTATGNGTLRVQSPTLVSGASSMTLGGTIDLQNNVTLSSGTTLNATSGSTLTSTAGFSYGGAGTFNLNGTSTMSGRWFGPGGVNVGATGTATTAGGVFFLDGESVSIAGHVIVTSGVGAQPNFGKSGELVLNGGLLSFPVSVAVDALVSGPGTVDIPSGSAPGFSSYRFSVSTLNVGGDPFWTNANPSFGINDVVNLNGGSLNYPAAASFADFHGTLNGHGTIVCNCVYGLTSATVNPGGVNAAGKIIFTGDLAVGGSTINVEIGGPTAETDYDVLQVNGQMRSNGNSQWTLNTTTINGYNAAPGTTFETVHFASAVNMPAVVANGADYQITVNPTNITATKVALLAPRSDFDADGHNDILLHNGTNGANAAWRMNGTAFAGIVDMQGFPGTPAGNADFNGDGFADIVAVGSSGQRWILEMTRTTITHVVTLPPIPNADVHTVGAGDLDGDGLADIVHRNVTTGANSAWMNTGTAFTTTDLPALPDTNYELVAVADFNNDGKADIVWRNQLMGSNAVWLMDGSSLLSIVDLPTLPNTQYHIVGVADMDGDTDPDIILHNAVTGQVAIWVMNGTSLGSIVDLPGLTTTAYTFVGPR